MLGIHTTLSAALRVPELELGKEEAAELAKAYADVAAYYPVLNIDPKFAAMANFGTCLSIIYGTRFAAFKMRMANEKPANPSAPGHRAAPQPAPIPQQAPQPINGAPTHQPDVSPVTREMRTAHIPGVGPIEFPADDPLVGGKAKH